MIVFVMFARRLCSLLFARWRCWPEIFAGSRASARDRLKSNSGRRLVTVYYLKEKSNIEE